MKKMTFDSPGTRQDNVSKIAALFPSVITETRAPDGSLKKGVDFDALRQLLAGDIAEGREVYGLMWPGKKEAAAEAFRAVRKTLRPCPSDSVCWDTTENVYIEGDNLDVLKLLQENYLAKIKIIYIDPPYNTGNDFIYRDNFSAGKMDYLKQSGNFDEDGDGREKLVSNPSASGRFHSDWCSMIYPRLLLARNLLAEDGVIFISIDENEFSSTKTICNEVFGESNFIAELVWAAGRKNDSRYISMSHEYILCYFKNMTHMRETGAVWRERKQGLDAIYREYDKLKGRYGEKYDLISKDLKSWFKNLPEGHPSKEHAHYDNVDEKGIFFPDNISWPGGGGPRYKILHPVTRRPVKIPSRGWLAARDTMTRWISEGRINFGLDENSVPTLKAYLKEREYSVPYSVFYKDGRASSKRLAALFGAKIFENPKDEEIIKRIFELAGLKDGDIVLDFFAGSSTTAHAVFLANVSANTHAAFILVQIPEIIDPSRAKAEKSRKVAANAVSFLDTLGRPHNICEIGKERIRRAAAKIELEYGASARCLDTGFRVFKCDSSNMEDVDYAPAELAQGCLPGLVSNIKADRTDLDLLFGCVLAWGLPLSLPHQIRRMHGHTVHFYDGISLVCCFEKCLNENTIRDIAAVRPLRVVFRDSAFTSSDIKINAFQHFRDLSPETAIRML